MDSVLYLPVTSQLLCDASLKRLMKSLQSATKNSSSSEQYRNFNTSRRRKNFSIPLSLAAAVLTLIVSAAIFGWDMLVCILGCFISLLFVRSSAEYLLHWTTSRFYLKESTAFAENCDMIDTRPSTGVNMGNDDKIDSKPRQAVLSSIGALKLATTPVDNGRTVIVTGATGFVGSCLLRDLLQHRDMLSLKRIIAICRKKGESSAQCRVSNLLSTPLFESFADSKWGEIIEVVEGDVTKEFAGLAPMDLARICQDETITHIFNCAAAVSFTQELSDAARSNVTSALNMQALAVRLKNNAKFVHVSTSFVHGDLTGSCDSPLPEKLFSFGPFDPVEVYKSMLDTQYYASKALAELGFHNTYSFSKSVCEHLLALQNGVNTIIIRPSIVGPAMETPFEGWAGEKPSTIVAGPCLHLSCQWNIWFLGRQKVSCVPVDVLARYVIAKAFDDHLYSEPSSVSDVASSSDGSFEHVSRINDQSSDFEEVASTASSSGSCCHHIRIFNATWNDNENQKASFSWLEFSVAYLHLGSVLGYFSRSSALLQLLISAQILPEIVPNNQNLFQLLHRTFVRAPLEYFRSVCEWTGVSTNRISKLLVFLDLPLLFFPFVKRDFFFESELFAPDDFDAQRYGFSCGVAAHRFISSKTAEAPKLAIQRLSCLVIGGKICPHKSFLGWAFAQPKGKFLVRVVAAVIGWFLKKISTVVTVDVISFQSTIAAMKKREDDCTLVLTPTHRSFLDFILLSFAVFSVPEMHIDLPFIVASNEFENLPLIGTLASLLGAFYIRRGRDSADKALAARLRSLKEHDGATCIEVFIEGKRSRDRRFERPKNGVLKCLKESGGDHVIVPVTINYERIPEQEILSEEASGGARNSLNVFGLLGWMKEAAKGNVQIGKIHIGASDPIFLDCKSDQEFSHLVKNIQIQQQHEVVVSEYHVMAAAKLFEVPQTEMRNAMIHLGCRFWPETAITDLPDLPSDTSSLLSITLQWSHVLAPLFADSRKDWSMWLNWTPVRDSTSLRNTVKDLDLSSLALRERLAKFFDSAEVIVQESILKLIATGFEEPSLEHIFQTSKSMSQEDIPLPILYAAASMAASEINKRDYPSLAMIDNVVQNSTSTSAGEKLGFWGFDDSGFVIRIDVQGRRHVTMKGVRYSLCGRSLRRLLPFMESALQVKVDLSKEFVSAAPLWHADVETNLSNQDQAFLVDVFQARISLSMIERTRHGSGHSQEDVMSLRMAERVRVPDAVVWPLSEDEVTILITAANTHGWCLIPFGGGTNVTGATKCPSREKEPRPIISVDMRRMNRVLCLNEEDGLAHVEAGIVGQDLVNLLASRGYTMGHEPDSLEFSTLGGWIATKASGMKRSKYGNIEDIVKSTRMVGLNGVLWKGSASSDKTCAGRVAEGMGVSSFALGSEGCLGIITSAVIRVWPLPETKQYSGILFPDFQSGLQFVRALSRQPSKMPACVRLLDNAHFRMGQALKPDHLTWLESVQEVISRSWLYVAACGKDMDPERVVCATICFEGATTEVREQIQTVNTLVNRFGGIQLGSKAGKAGYELTYMIAYLRDFAMTYHILGESFETFAPWSKIETLVAATKDRLLKEHSKRLLPGVPFVGCRVTQLYHEGACLYFYLCMSFYGVKRSSHIFAELEKAARDEILKQGGSLSHHHGLGKLRSSFVQDRTSPAFRQVVAAVKESMDKNNIFGAHNGLFADVEKGGESSES
jgi:alkyldihydroxyacetonephosphate synthase